MATAKSDLAPQLMRLFYASGLVKESDWKGYSVRHEKHKPIMDVLTQDVSLGTFRDLLNAEITLRSQKGPGRKAKQQLHQGLTTSGIVNRDELHQLMANHGWPVERVLQPLLEDGLIDRQTYDQAMEAAGADEGTAYDWLFTSDAISAQAICNWLSQLNSAKVREAALLVSLQVLRYNRHMAEGKYQKYLPLLEKHDFDTVVKKLAGDDGLASKRIVKGIEEGMSLPQINLTEVEIDPGLLELFPQSWIRRQMSVPFFMDDSILGLATTDPLNIHMVAMLNWLTGRWVHTQFCPSGMLIQKINQQMREDGAAVGTTPPPEPAVGAVEGREQPGAPKAKKQKAQSLAKGVPKPAGKPSKAEAEKASQVQPVPAPKPEGKPSVTRPVLDAELVGDNISAVQLVSSLVESAIDLNATDIHIEPIRDGLSVRYRIDGELHRILTVPPSLAQSVVSRVKILADMDVTERRRPQDGHFELQIMDNNFDFRISTLPAVLGEKVVIRILEAQRVMKGLDDLGLLPKQRETVEWMLRHPMGMILVSGPTGSGKTSTLYTALNRLNQENRNLVTIEDPVEYQLPGINQVQVDPHVELDFANGLRSILRQDPDVIMVGEIRDKDTAAIAVRAAMTGHVVFSTLHANTSLGAVDTMIHLGSVPVMLANSLVGLISQRLVRTLCPDCRKGKKLTEALAQRLGQPKPSPRTRKKVYEPVGCDQCLNTGYRGRTAVFETIGVNETLRTMIAERKSLHELEKKVRQANVLNLYQAGIQKVLAGETSVTELTEKVVID